jgi:hypothetical protein
MNRLPTFLASLTFFLFSISATFVSGCNRQTTSPTPASIPGTYTGNYFGGQETIVIRQNGRFTQLFIRGNNTIYTNSGNWSINGERIRFDNFYYFLPNQQLIKGGAFSTDYREEGTLILNSDNNYIAQKAR